MTEEAAKHSTTLALASAVPPDIVVGATFDVKVSVECSEGCDLSGSVVEIKGPDARNITSGLTRSDRNVCETAAIALTAPATPGAHVWAISFPGHDSDGVGHQ